MFEQTKKQQVAALRRDGFVISRGLVDSARLAQIREVAVRQLTEGRAPVEYEAALRYPGAPDSREAPGGDTIRRLLDAYARDAVFRDFATSAEIRTWMEMYFGEPAILSRAHHNCVMTKHPDYGSLTGWHRDARYWSFQRDDLVSVWLALGSETPTNGGLWLVPGSHLLDLPKDSFDAQAFFLSEQPQNQGLITQAISPTLEPGDALFFHCNTLHSAGRNLSADIKYSVVFTYHARGNAARVGTRSASKPEQSL